MAILAFAIAVNGASNFSFNAKCTYPAGQAPKEDRGVNFVASYSYPYE